MAFPHTYRTKHSETRTTNGNYGEYYRSLHANKIKIQPDLLQLLQYVDSNQEQFVLDLQEAIAIQSIAGKLKYKQEVIKMVKLVERWMVAIGAKHECFYIGYHELDGENVRLPPVVLGTVQAGADKKTVCVYGHIDVRSPKLNEWNTNPWEISTVNKIMYGNGVIHGKGPLLAWFHTIMGLKKMGVELPVNVKFIIEAMHVQSSQGLKEFLMTQKQTFLHDIDYIVVTDSEWLGDKYPCISYGSIANLKFEVTITKTSNSKSQPKDDMEKIFEKVAKDDVPIIPNFNKHVIAISPDEEALFEKIEFDLEEYRKNLPASKKDWSKSKLLMHFWRMPTIVLGDVLECICDKNDKTSVKRNFVIKIVSKQNAENCIKLTTSHIKSVAKNLKIENKIDIKSSFKARPWIEDNTSINYEAARRATIQIYKEDPSMIREDRQMLCINILQMMERNILLLPMGVHGSRTGRSNENLPLRNYIEGTKLMGAYLFQIALLSK